VRGVSRVFAACLKRHAKPDFGPSNAVFKRLSRNREMI
jgi:hypothetical protein